MKKSKIIMFAITCLLVIGMFPASVLANTECTVPGCNTQKLYWEDDQISYGNINLYVTVGTKGEIDTYYIDGALNLVSVCPHGTYKMPFTARMLENYDPCLIGIEQQCVVNYHGAQLTPKILNVYPAKKFSDVGSYDWYAQSVEFVQTRGFMTGLNDTEFGPTVGLSRAQFAVSLYRMAGEPKVEYHNEFADIEDNMWYTDAIAWCSQNGIITGYTNTGLFGPADLATREQTVTILYRFANYKGYDTSKRASLDKFPDAGSVSAFAKASMEWAVANNIITGDNGKINPQGTLHRAEASVVISRFVTLFMDSIWDE